MTPAGGDVRQSPARVVAGVVLAVVAVTSAGIAAYLRGEERKDQRRECERILGEMQSALSSALADEGGVDFGSPSQETGWAMDERASALDVEVAQQDSGIFVSYVVTKGNEVLGTVDDDGISQNRC